MKDIQERVLNIFEKSFAIDSKKIEMSSRLNEDLGINVITTEGVELLEHLEEEFEISIPNEDFVEVKTVQDLIKLIQNNIKEK